MSPRIALATALALLTLPVAAHAAPDRSTTLDAANKAFTWQAPAAASLGVVFWDNSDPVGSCAQAGIHCDQTWLKVATPGDIAATLADGGDGATSDWDLYLYEADESGNPTKMIQESFNIAAPESVALIDAAPGNYVVLILYYNSLGISGTEGAVAFEPSAATSAPAPAAPAGGGAPGSTPPPAAAANAAPKSRIGRLARSAKASKVKRFSGTASDDAKVSRVDIALTRAKGSKCQSMTSSGKWRTTPKKGKRCVPTVFVKAKGTGKWTYTLRKRLTKGSYTLFSRATDDTGAREAGFGSANTKTFKVT